MGSRRVDCNRVKSSGGRKILTDYVSGPPDVAPASFLVFCGGVKLDEMFDL